MWSLLVGLIVGALMYGVYHSYMMIPTWTVLLALAAGIVYIWWRIK